MEEKLRNYYLESQVNNASPGQMLVMLYDELLQQAEFAEARIAEPPISNNFGAASHAVSRCINMLTELNTSLNHGVSPKLCGVLSDLYLFFTQQFSEALAERQAGKIRAIVPLIRNLRDTWSEADRRANRFEPGSVAVAA